MLLKFILENKIKIVIVTVLFLILLLLVWVFVLLNQKTFYQGVKVEGIDVSGLDMNKAKVLMQEKLERASSGKKIVLKHEDMLWEIDTKDISYGFLVDDALKNAYMLGREGNLPVRLKTIFDLRLNNKDSLTIRPTFSKARLLSIIRDIKSQVDKKEKNASVVYKNGNITFDKEIIGQIIDIDKNMNLIENKILERDFSLIVLDVQKVYPKVLYDDISDIEEVVASFSTSFNPNKANRSYNIKLACERINNKLLLPGDVFSMDSVLGPRTIENGYKDAPVIIKSKLIEGTGGGVCQVTTTLYVAVLKAKLDVVERTSHSLPLGYVEPGQDATIAEGYIDFKFRNNKQHAVLVSASVVGSRIVIRLVSKKDAFNYNVKLRSVVIERMNPGKDEIVVDATVPDGSMVFDRESVQGLKVAVYRETYDNNKLVEREKISEDVYKPVRGRVRVSPNYYRHISSLQYAVD
ncbi:MAG: VanW family protein [Bacillota bacterium]